jgi:phosphoglycerate dehydrogenase-like enzyme
MKRKILVTPRSATSQGHAALDNLCAAGFEVVFCQPGVQPSEEELCALLPGCIGYLAGVERISARAMDAAPELRVISRNGTGVDGIDLAAAQARDIAVLRAEGANARGVAELTIGYLFSLVRRISDYDASLKNVQWARGGIGVELQHKTLGLIGCGCVGQMVARLALAIGMQVMAFDPLPDAGFSPGDGFRYAPLDEVLAQADFVSLHCPPCEDGLPLLDAAAFAQMKTGAFIVNTARAALIDSEALLGALETRKIAAAALDVFEDEPIRDWRLGRHPRVVATPHIGGFTQESVDRAMTAAVGNLLRALGAE